MVVKNINNQPTLVQNPNQCCSVMCRVDPKMQGVLEVSTRLRCKVHLQCCNSVSNVLQVSVARSLIQSYPMLISLKNLLLILLNFQWQDCSTFNNSCTVCQSIAKTTSMHSYSWREGLPMIPRAQGALWFGRSDISTWQKKQNIKTILVEGLQ